jgi:hypothetical protein
MKRALSIALALAFSLGGAAVARAGEGARLEARSIAEQGDAQFYAGRCDKAVALWRKADAVYHAPTLLVRVARCQAFLGQVVAAVATLESVVDETPKPDAPPAFVAAREDGQRELPGLRARIATLRIIVRPRGGAAPLTVEIDGSPAPASADPIPVDPGTHRVCVRGGEASWEREVHLDDGEERRLDVALWVAPLPALRPVQRTVGLTALGIGVASLATGVGLSMSALSTTRALEAACGPDRTPCTPSQQGTLDRTRSYSFAADGTLVGGAVLVVAAAVLLTADLNVGRDSRVRVAVTPGGVVCTGEL